MTTLGTFIYSAALVVGLSFATTAEAGRGGSARKIQQAITSGSSDAIIAELERAEGLACGECVTLVARLTEDSRYEVREVAGWWFAKRPGLSKPLAEGFVADLASGDTIAVRNAADFLGATVSFTALPALRAAIGRELGVEARLALVRAAKSLAHIDGNPVLTTAMRDGTASVRVAAVEAWRDIRTQTDATPAVALLADTDAGVRAAAATVVGAMGGTAGLSALQTLVASDADPFVRRNAAWALGQLGGESSRDALMRATTDKSGLVRMTAKAALAALR